MTTHSGKLYKAELFMTEKITFDERDFKAILDGMVDGVITINQKGIVLTFNKTAETIFGYDSEEIIGKNVSLLMPEPQKSAHDSYLNNHINTGENHIIGIGRDVTALRKSGETFAMRLSVIEYPAKIQGDRWFIGSCRDITLQKQQEEQLKRSLKMDAIGKLTSGIAHDYNNIIGVISGFSELLAKRAEKHPEFHEYINHIRKAADRASNLTSQLLSITRKRKDDEEETDINSLLENNKEVIAKSLTSSIKLYITTDKELWPVFVEKGRLEDTILNLSINAMHAMPEGGELGMTTSNYEINSVDSQVLQITPGDYVKLAVSDTGIGMTEEIVCRIFEPFYSTKGESGTGLGLSQVFNFIDKSKGSIKVYSEPGHGTCFSIYLPRYIADKNTIVADKKTAKTTTDELHGLGQILVVDDEKTLLTLVENILSSHDYDVYCASNANEALNILENHPIDAVLSDIIMPDIDGYELAHMIHYKYPHIKIQLYSGFDNAKGKSVTSKSLAEDILAKPFTTKQLLTKIKKLLD